MISQFKQLDYRNLSFAIISGFIMTAAFPKTGFDFLAWFAFVPLIWTLNQTSTAFTTGCVAGFVHQITLVYWLTTAMHEYGHLPLITCIPLLILLCLYLSLYTGIFCIMVKRLCPTPGHLILVPFFWVALEYARSLTQFAFPWELMGYSQYLKLPLIQVADITGVYGISWLILLFNVAIVCFLLHTTRQTWQTHPVSIKMIYVFLGGVILFFVLFMSYGLYRIATINNHIEKSDNKLKVATVQGNIDQAVKWDETFRTESTQKYLHLSMSENIQDADLIVWPETAIPFYIQQDTKLSQLLRSFINDHQPAFLIGGLRYEHTSSSSWNFYNSAFLLFPGATNNQAYDKSHLVPYGEYIPFQTVFPFLKKMVEAVGDFSEGTTFTPLKWDKYSVGPQICYEILFPNLSRNLVQNGADILVNITNDAWYGRSSAPYQHFSMAVFRAVENKRSLARAANTGISGCINPFGKILTQSQIFVDDARACQMPVLNETTFYARYGDVFAIFCSIVLMVSILVRFFRYRL